jgi:hypothetical protein
VSSDWQVDLQCNASTCCCLMSPLSIQLIERWRNTYVNLQNLQLQSPISGPSTQCPSSFQDFAWTMHGDSDSSLHFFVRMPGWPRHTWQYQANLFAGWFSSTIVLQETARPFCKSSATANQGVVPLCWLVMIICTILLAFVCVYNRGTLRKFCMNNYRCQYCWGGWCEREVCCAGGDPVMSDQSTELDDRDLHTYSPR